MQVTKEICYNQTSLSGKLDIAGMKAAYDENVKRLLGEKVILAHILVHTVPEYKGLEVEEVIPLIEDMPRIAEVPVYPGETNCCEITGDNTENTVAGEGRVTFDVRFHTWLPGRVSCAKLLIDLEAQKKYFPGYDIVTRGVFYSARMVSAQLGTEFAGSDYDSIKKVYSIWVCMDVPVYAENTITEYSMVQKNIAGNFPMGKSRYDLQSIIVIGLPGNISDIPEEQGIHRLLGVLLSGKIPSEEKKAILEKEYHIPMTKEMDRRAKLMCNLSEAIEERGMEKGLEKGLEKGSLMALFSVVRNMMQKDIEADVIADLSGKEAGIINKIYSLISENRSADDETLANIYMQNR